jgi:hypothetical protein
MIFAEFGLVYGNDWLIAPIQLYTGSMCRVKEITITDTFGKETMLQEIQPDENWSFFQTAAGAEGKRWLFLTDNTDLIQESQPVENVSFLRDEMANMVWAVEEVVNDPYGGGRDAEALAKKTAEFARSLSPREAGFNGSGSSADVTVQKEGQVSSEGWKYKAGTMMAENRIPFIAMAVATNDQDAFNKRKVILRRAALPRVGDDFTPVRIRPRTGLLGRLPGSNEEAKPVEMKIFEEEIPRSGISLSLNWKRTRWFNGQTMTWLARKKKIGKGEIDANFQFDMLKK